MRKRLLHAHSSTGLDDSLTSRLGGVGRWRPQASCLRTLYVVGSTLRGVATRT